MSCAHREKRREEWTKIGLTDIAHLWKFRMGGIRVL
jgi:hypothetical protein